MSISDKLITIAEKQQAVYDEGIKQGRQAEYDAFWDVFQGKGEREKWDYQFHGSYWNGNTFKPKHDMTVKTANNMFSTNYANPKIDLRESALGIKIDFSKCTTFNNAFSSESVITAIGILDTRSVSGLSNMFNYASALHTVEKWILKDDGSQTTMNMSGASKLENITVEGVIGDNINFQSSPLTKASIESIMNCLSETSSGKTLTLKDTAIANAFETSEGAADGCNSEEWLTLVATRPNWRIVAGSNTWNS